MTDYFIFSDSIFLIILMVKLIIGLLFEKRPGHFEYTHYQPCALKIFLELVCFIVQLNMS